MSIRAELFYIAATVLLTVYGQIAVKWHLLQLGHLPEALWPKTLLLARQVAEPLVWSALLAGILAGLFWMAALARLPLSYAYPLVSATFVLVFLASVIIFRESADLYRIVGHVLIVAGIIVSSWSL